MTTAEAPGAVAFDPFDAAFRADPYPVYARLREEAPAHRSPFGMWVLSRHADCVAVLRDARWSSDERNSSDPSRPVERDGMKPFLFLDPPDHTRLRGLVSKAFTPKVVEGLRPRAQQIVDGLLERAEAAGRMELVEDFAYPLPVVVISEMLGVPPEDEARFKGWSRSLARGLDPDFVLPPEVMQERDTAIFEFADYFRELIAARRTAPGDDLLSALVAVEEQGDTLSEDELISTCVLLLVAGHETTVNLIANGALALLRHPAELARLRRQPELAKTAVEELLRYDPPVQLTGRVALTEVDVAGVTVGEGELAVLLLGAANRDPAQFSEPDDLDLARADNRHLAFGFGAHFCLGAPLARAEGQIALSSLVRRFPGLALATDDLHYKENLVLRGLEALPVTL